MGLPGISHTPVSCRRHLPEVTPVRGECSSLLPRTNREPFPAAHRKQGAKAIPLCASKQHNVRVLTKQFRVQLQHFPASSERCSLSRRWVDLILCLGIIGLRELPNPQRTQVIFCYCQPETSQMLRRVILTAQIHLLTRHPTQINLGFALELLSKSRSSAVSLGSPPSRRNLTLPQDFNPPWPTLLPQPCCAQAGSGI